VRPQPLTDLDSRRNGRTAEIQDLTDRENAVMELAVRRHEEAAFTRRMVEDLARIRVAVTNDLPLVAEQLAARALVIAQRRHRQIAHTEVDLTRWGIR
jgi:predicted transcriptional regulator